MRGNISRIWTCLLVSFLLVAGCFSMLLAQPPAASEAPKIPVAQQLAPSQTILIPQVPPIGKDEILYTPDSSVRWALHDLKSIPPEVQPYIRYLSLYNIPKKDRPSVAKTISFVVNSLSTRRHPYIPSFVSGSDETVIRINIKDYNWKAEVWENFAKKGSGVRPFPEPYFHAFIAPLVPAKRVTETDRSGEKDRSPPPSKQKDGSKDGSNGFAPGAKIEVIVQSAPVYRPGTSNEVLIYMGRGIQLEVIRVHSRGLCLVKTSHGNGWIEQSACKVITPAVTEIPPETPTVPVEVEVKKPVQLVPDNKNKKFSHAPWLTANIIAELAFLAQSESPIIRGDWFVANAVVPPAYYDFLNLGKNVADFEKLVFANEKTSAENHLQDKGVVIQSSVARNNRTLTRSSTLSGGYYWISHDSLKSVDDRKYIQNILDEKFDATEIIGTLPNGLQAYFVSDGKGVRADFAATDIAIDNTAVDRTVRPGRSCMICHSDGIRPIDDEVRKITEFFRNAEQVRLLIPDEKKAYRVKDLYGSNMTKQVWKDQQFYQDAVNEVTGLDMRKNASALSDNYDKYAEFLLTKEVVQREVGLPMAQLEAFIRKSEDPVILGMIKTPIRPIRRDQWEESFQHFMLVILAAPPHGAIPPSALPPPIHR